MAFLRQFQKDVKEHHDGGVRVAYIEADADDITLAAKLAHTALGRALDELPPGTRLLLGALHGYVSDRGAYVHLGRCFDLTDTWATHQLGRYHDDLIQRLSASGRAVPVNRKAGPNDFDLVLRHLDCAVINYALASMDRRSLGGGPFFQTVRGVFVEGPPAFPGAGIHIKSHVQVADKLLRSLVMARESIDDYAAWDARLASMAKSDPEPLPQRMVLEGRTWARAA